MVLISRTKLPMFSLNKFRQTNSWVLKCRLRILHFGTVNPWYEANFHCLFWFPTSCFIFKNWRNLESEKSRPKWSFSWDSFKNVRHLFSHENKVKKINAVENGAYILFPLTVFINKYLRSAMLKSILQTLGRFTFFVSWQCMKIT